MLHKLIPLVLFASVAGADSSVPVPPGAGILVTPTATRLGYLLDGNTSKIRGIDTMRIGDLMLVAGRDEVRTARARLRRIGRGGHGRVFYIEQANEISWSTDQLDSFVRVSLGHREYLSHGWQLACRRCAAANLVDALRALRVQPLPQIDLRKL